MWLKYENISSLSHDYDYSLQHKTTAELLKHISCQKCDKTPKNTEKKMSKNMLIFSYIKLVNFLSSNWNNKQYFFTSIDH